MKVQTARFGEIEVPRDKLIDMVRPILGFESLKQYCLVEIEELNPFLWLQSTEEATASFLVVNPALLFPDYKIEINPNEISELKVNRVESVETYVIVTIPENPEQMSVNLQGPVMINTENNRAKQLILVNTEYDVQHPVIDAINNMPKKEEMEKELVAI